MSRSRFGEEQIIGILKEHEAGFPVADLCRKHGVSDGSIQLDRLITERGQPKMIVSDNGSEFASNATLP